MILGLLLAQDLRVCMHGLAEAGAFDATTGVTHLETNLITDDGDGVASPDWHTSFSIALKQLGAKLELLAIVVTVALLVLPLARQATRLPAPPAAVARPCSFHALRPPLRAPPL